ncbi:MAG: glycosyltransferase family 4 protein [Anaerolineales bacterium]|nr:glycosyltransferase family 4 protein [Anaerolineales bacterium]MBX3036840.1 glycosyltransferase family 4 protein [Anaerolineales bacterium]
MRIAYVSLHWARTKNSGVGKKIQSQVKIWKEMGHEARLFMHTSQHEPPSELIEAEIFPYQTKNKFQTEVNRIRAAKQMVKSIEAFKPDIIYLRYGIYVYPAHQLMRIALVVEEINTNDLTQHEGLGGIYSLYNRLTRGIFLRRVAGLVTVSQELAVSSAFAKYQKPTCVIANGIELEALPTLPPASNKIPRLAFIGSPDNHWHGVDKLILLANLAPDIHIDIIGYNQLPQYLPLPNNITLHGYLTLEQYKKTLAMADVAISSLALHRVKLEEASPLKSRECLAFGLPLITAYDDTDLTTQEHDFLLKIPNKEDNIQTHFSSIRDFAYRMRGYRVERKQIVQLDQKSKELRRFSFFHEILEKNKTLN